LRIFLLTQVSAGYIEPSDTLRLASQNNAGCGRVEILYQCQWGTVCDDNWGSPEAIVACRQLGRNPSAIYISFYGSAVFGQGSGMIWMDEMACTGSESTLVDCPRPGWGVHDCDHREDAGICCFFSTGLTGVSFCFMCMGAY
jgi:hypothetical protein